MHHSRVCGTSTGLRGALRLTALVDLESRAARTKYAREDLRRVRFDIWLKWTFSWVHHTQHKKLVLQNAGKALPSLMAAFVDSLTANFSKTVGWVSGVPHGPRVLRMCNMKQSLHSETFCLEKVVRYLESTGGQNSRPDS